MLIGCNVFQEIKCSELRTMCIQVVIAALYKNPDLVLGILNTTKIPNSEESITYSFIKQWMNDLDCFFGLHDRKLCVLGLCTLLEQHCGGKVDVVNGSMQTLIPSFLTLFSGLRRAYQCKLYYKRRLILPEFANAQFSSKVLRRNNSKQLFIAYFINFQ